MNLSQITSKLSPKGWLMVGGSAAATLVFFYILFSLASAPSYSTLLAGVNPAQTGKITSALSAAGVSYQLQNNGTAVAVQSGQQSQARVTLATAGLLGSSANSSGLSGFSTSSSLGQSDFQQQVAYQSALEGQLNSAIDQIQGVSSAQVQLAIPSQTDQLFSVNQSTPSASVLISDSGDLSSGSVKGIADLVASAVTGLNSAKVTITDQNGQLLWPSSGGGAAGLLAKQNAQSTYDTAEASQVDAMLAATLGPGKAVVQVNADLNTNQTTLDSVTYKRKSSVPLSTNASSEKLTGATPSSSTNGVPSYTSTGNSNSKYSDTTNTTTYGVDKTVTQQVVSPGAINLQSVSVLVSKTVPASELPSITSAVSNAVGLNKKRGDTISVAQIAFAKAPVAAVASSPTKMLGYAKYGVIGLGAMIFLFFTSRMLRRRENEGFAGTPTWLRELEAPRSLASLEAAQGPLQGDAAGKVKQLRSPQNIARQQVDELVERDPDRVAAQVRAWMGED
jgi:flagellar M-ring protein FliF